MLELLKNKWLFLTPFLLVMLPYSLFEIYLILNGADEFYFNYAGGYQYDFIFNFWLGGLAFLYAPVQIIVLIFATIISFFQPNTQKKGLRND